MVYENGIDVGWKCINAVNGKCGIGILLDPGMLAVIIILIVVGLIAVRILLKAKELRTAVGEY
jgi:hypothetical protein